MDENINESPLIIQKHGSGAVTDKICNFLSKAVLLLAFVIFTLLTVGAFLNTTHYKAPIKEEIMVFWHDNIPLNIIVTLLFFVTVILVGRCCKGLWQRINLQWATVAMLLLVTGLSVWWVLSVSSVPSSDSAVITISAKQIVSGDWTSFKTGTDYYNGYPYYQFYPFQLGYTLICEVMFRLFGTDNWFALQLLNVIALDLIFAGLVKITHLTFKKKAVTLAVIITLAGCFQGIFFTSFSYGNLLGVAGAVWAVVFATLYMMSNKKLYVIPTSICMAFSVICKYNNMIVLAAIAIVLVLFAVKNRKIFSAVFTVILCVVTVAGSSGVTALYEARSGVQLSGGVSQLLYLSMSMDESARCPGWYNAEAMKLYRDNDLDIDKAEAQAKENISKRLNEFKENPKMFVGYYAQKMFSQWNEPSYDSIWVSQVKKHYNDVGALGTAVYSKTGTWLFDHYFNYYQQIIFLGFAVGMFAMFRKKHDLCSITLPIIILGGFAYHMLFEAKSQYILSYFMLMIPYASYGIYRICSIKSIDKLCGKIKGLGKKKSKKEIQI